MKQKPVAMSAEERRRWRVVGTVMVGIFMAVLDNSIVNVALPHMTTAFATNTDRIRWTVEAYAISYAVFTLTMTWLRERLGIRATFMAGLFLFTVSSALCGVAWSLEAMIAFRILQGVGGGVMMPTGFTLITESFPPERRGAAFGVFGVVVVFAPSLGPTLGGWLVDSVNWRYIFYVNVPVGAFAMLLSAATLRETKKLAPHPFDFWGFAGLAAFLSCLLIALTDGQREGWNSDYILSLFAFSALGLAVFIALSPRARKPILNLGLFRNFHFSMIAILNIARSVALFGRLFLLPLFFQNLIGYSATVTGLLLSPSALMSGIVMPVTGPLVDRYGPRWFIIGGLALMGVANLMYFNLDVTTPYMVLLAPILIFGVGAGLLNTPITATAMNVVRRDQISEVSTVLSVLMQMGGAFGVAMLGTLTTARAAFHQAVYAERMDAWSHATQSALAGAQALGERVGESAFLAQAQAPALLNMLVSKQALITAYQDAFVATAAVCAAGLIPAMGLIRLKRTGGAKVGSR